MAGLPETRIKSVIGDADRDPLLPADPLAAANRRIAILVMRDVAERASAARCRRAGPPHSGPPVSAKR